MKKIFIKIKILINVIKQCNTPQIMDIVIYNNENCFIIQRLKNNHFDLKTPDVILKKTNSINYNYYNNIHISKFKRKFSIKKYIYNFNNLYKTNIQLYNIISFETKK